ncbi:MAG: AmmeMemoRadiSam system radical SAM enzyme [Ignavibacteriales bacterium]|nr:AmmeMemoRadiSam system radical SAM enzyme [Ignavibacteriales bacterium]
MQAEFPALWWEKTTENKILCTLCPRYCTIGNGQHGFCYIRKNSNGQLVSLGYGQPSGFGLDPIEKKPLNHFFPGSQILSFGTAGCNLGCKFCQNWHISKAKDVQSATIYYSPEQVVAIALQNKIPSIAFTYNDPVIFGEYVIDIARIARHESIKTVMVTAGYITKQARPDVFQNIDAANVDLKAFSEAFYHKLTYSHLEDVLDTLLWIKHETDIWLEVTTLLIPGYNDSPEEIHALCNWLLNNLGESVPLHFTAFHPDFKMLDVQRTSLEKLITARKIALETGLQYCYIGNVQYPEGHITYCPVCKKAVIIRDYYQIVKKYLKNNRCQFCNYTIAGIY